MLITLIGGRIVPSFTRNWLARENPGRLPVPFGRFDVIVIAASVGRARRSGSRSPQTPPAGVMLLVAGVLHAHGWRAGPATARCASGWC